MDLDLAVAIGEAVPAAEYGGSTSANTRESYDLLTWNDPRPKPTWEEVLEAWDVWSSRYIFEEKNAAEQAWRRAELEESTSQIHRFEDGDDDREPGTLEQWRAYRKSVRHWVPGADGYLDESMRPKRPE